MLPIQNMLQQKHEQGPTAPSGLTATARSDTQIRTSWGSVSGATDYIVEMESPVRMEIATTSVSYIWTGLQPNTQYCFRITARSPAGVSQASDRVCVRTLESAQVAPDTPTGFESSAVSDDVIVTSWDSMPRATEYVVTRVSPGAQQTQTVTSTSTAWTGLSPNTEYCFTVAARNSGGTSTATARHCSTTLAEPPPPPTVPDEDAVSRVEIARLVEIEVSPTETLRWAIYGGLEFKAQNNFNYNGQRWDTTKLKSVRPGEVEVNSTGPSATVVTMPNAADWDVSPGPLKTTISLLSRQVGTDIWLELLSVTGRMSGLVRNQDQSYEFNLVPESLAKVDVSERTYSHEGQQQNAPGDNCFDRMGIGFSIQWPPDPSRGGTGIGLTTSSTPIHDESGEPEQDDGSSGVGPDGEIIP